MSNIWLGINAKKLAIEPGAAVLPADVVVAVTSAEENYVWCWSFDGRLGTV